MRWIFAFVLDLACRERYERARLLSSFFSVCTSDRSSAAPIEQVALLLPTHATPQRCPFTGGLWTPRFRSSLTDHARAPSSVYGRSDAAHQRRGGNVVPPHGTPGITSRATSRSGRTPVPSCTTRVHLDSQDGHGQRTGRHAHEAAAEGRGSLLRVPQLIMNIKADVEDESGTQDRIPTTTVSTPGAAWARLTCALLPARVLRGSDAARKVSEGNNCIYAGRVRRNAFSVA